MVFGYPSALAHIAQHAASRGQSLDDIGVRVVFVTSERLYPEQRDLIARAFGCRVANGYGGRDAGFIAHECPAGSMHLTAEDIIVEIVDGQVYALVRRTGSVMVFDATTGALIRTCCTSFGYMRGIAVDTQTGNMWLTSDSNANVWVRTTSPPGRPRALGCRHWVV